MTISPQEEIAGVRLVRVRDFLRRWGRQTWDVEMLRTHMRLPLEDTRRLIDALLREGYVEQNSAHGETAFCVTSRGAILAAASAAPRISRRTAERKLAEFLSRVVEVNENKKFAFTVAKVTVFGSYLSDVKKLGDIDLAVELRPRYEDRAL